MKNASSQTLRRKELLSWKTFVAPFAIPFVPLIRALVRYGPLALRTTIWNRICHAGFAGVPHRFTVSTDFGFFTGDSSDMIPLFVYYFGRWEPEISQLISERLESGNTFVDVGANTGWYTLLAAHKVGMTGHVVAIEASPTNFVGLTENVSKNRLRNVRLINEAAWSSQSFLCLFQGPRSQSGISTVVRSFAERRGCELSAQIRARPLSDLLTADEISTLRILKIDVEGSEREVLIGLEPILDSLRDDIEIILELSPSEYNVDEILRPLRKRGFRAWIIPNRYQPHYYLNVPKCIRKDKYEELSGIPDQQVDVLLSRTEP